MDIKNLTAQDLLNKLDEYIQMANQLGEEMSIVEQSIRDCEIKLNADRATLVIVYVDDGNTYNLAKQKAIADARIVSCEVELSKLKKSYQDKKIQYDVLIKAIDAVKSIGWVRSNELKTLRG